ncbi:MAG: LysR substrate-binding domain-containing protein [Pseudomonadota bacterium]
MNHVQLKAFHTVAQLGSVTKAAARLHITQPTVSDHIKSLEQRYEVKLFERRGRNLVLTSLGHALRDITSRQFRMEAEAEQLLLSATGLASGKLRVAADSPFLVVPLLSQFQHQHPNIDVSISFGNAKTVYENLITLEADVAVLPDVEKNQKLFQAPLKQDKLVCIVDSGHRFATRRNVRIDEFSTETLILREAGSHTRSIIEHALTQSGITPARSLILGSREGVREAVAAGLGIGVVGESEVGQDKRIHALTIRGAQLKVTEYFVCLNESRPTPVVSALYNLIDSL